MLKISLICVGDKMPAWVNDGAASYIQRIRGDTHVELIQLSAPRRGKNIDVAQILTFEGERICKQIPAGNLLICLDRKGKAKDSLALAAQMRKWQLHGQSVSFVIGGPEGISPAVLELANETWTFSAMTFSHHVVRVMLAEQLYRAWSINQGLPYHR